MSDLFLVSEVSFADLSLNFGLSILFALIWYAVFTYSARMIPNKTQYLRVFLLLAPTMVLIITIIKGSLALSLGLVGALSIVRFRTPIKEPSELLYLFVMIAIGLGLGADRVAETTIAFVFLCAVMVVLSLVRPGADYSHDYFIEVQFDGHGGREQPTASGLMECLGDLHQLARIKKFSREEHSSHAVLGVSSQHFDQLDMIMERLRQRHPVAHIALIENVNLIT